MASPARSQTPARSTPDVQTRPGSVPRAGVSNTAARKSSLQASRRHSSSPQTNARQKQINARGATPTFSSNEALRKSNFNASRLATTQPMVNPQPAQNRPAANDNEKTKGGEQNETTEEETNDEESTEQEMEDEEENVDAEKEEAAEDEEEAEVSDAESRSILQSDQLAARAQAASAQASASTNNPEKEKAKKIVMEGAAYSFGAIFGALDTLTGGSSIIVTFIGDIPILGRWNVQMLYGGKLPFIDKLSWEPIPLLPVIDPNAMGKKLLVIIADIVFVLLILCGMTLLGLIAYMITNQSEAAKLFGTNMVQLFATVSPS